MTPEELPDFNRRQPFTPYRIQITDGQTYDIRHPDQALVLRSRVILVLMVRMVLPIAPLHIALVHIVRIEELSESVA